MVPVRHTDRLGAIAAASSKITAMPEDYGLTADDAAALAAKVTAAKNAMEEANKYKALKEAKTQALQNALSDLTASFRRLQNHARSNASVSDGKLADIEAYRRPKPSRIGAPDSAPEVSVEDVLIGFADLRLIEPNTRSAKLPRTATGFEISLVNGTSPATAGEADTGVKTFVSKARCRISTDLGKPRLRVYARYVGRRAQYGPWSRPAEFSPRQP